jgi:hypothetical protein
VNGQLQELTQSGARLQSGSGVPYLAHEAGELDRVPELRFVREGVPA